MAENGCPYYERNRVNSDHRLMYPVDPEMPGVRMVRYRIQTWEELIDETTGLTKTILSRLPERRRMMEEKQGASPFGEEVYPLTPWFVGRVEQAYKPPLQYWYGKSSQDRSQLAAWWAYYSVKVFTRTPEATKLLQDAPKPRQFLQEWELADGLFHRLMIWKRPNQSDYLLVGVRLEVEAGRYVRATYTRIFRWGRNLTSDHAVEQTPVQPHILTAIDAAQDGTLPQTTALLTGTQGLPVIPVQDPGYQWGHLTFPPPAEAPPIPEERKDSTTKVVLTIVLIFLLLMTALAWVVWPNAFPFSLLH